MNICNPQCQCRHTYQHSADALSDISEYPASSACNNNSNHARQNSRQGKRRDTRKSTGLLAAALQMVGCHCYTQAIEAMIPCKCCNHGTRMLDHDLPACECTRRLVATRRQLPCHPLNISPPNRMTPPVEHHQPTAVCGLSSAEWTQP